MVKLNKREIQQISDLLSSPPATQKYRTLENRPIAGYEEFEQARFQKLISDIKMKNHHNYGEKYNI